MTPLWLLRAMRWVRNPPSQGRVVLVVVVVATCLGIWGVEHLVGFPDWLRPHDMRGLSR